MLAFRYMKWPWQDFDSLAAENGSFKEAVFTTENAYFNNRLDREVFDKYIHNLVKLTTIWSRYNKIQHYTFEDSVNFGDSAQQINSFISLIYIWEGNQGLRHI